MKFLNHPTDEARAEFLRRVHAAGLRVVELHGYAAATVSTSPGARKPLPPTVLHGGLEICEDHKAARGEWHQGRRERERHRR